MSKVLIEECLKWRFATMRRRLGRAALLEAYRRGQPITVPGLGVPIALTADTVYLPWKGSVSNPRAYTERLGFECPGCRRRVLVLYGVPNGLWLEALGCRSCLDLVYYSQNGQGNLWYEHVVKPKRRLRRIDARLAHRLCIQTRLQLEQESAWLQDPIAFWEARLRRTWRRVRRRPPPRSMTQWSGKPPIPLKRPYRGMSF